jgi:hypothetical protein
MLTVVDGHKLYGIDEQDQVILSPEDFRGTVTKSFALGTFKEGDYFDVDIDEEGKPIRRSFDNTVAIHSPIEKRYSRSDVMNIIKKVKYRVEEGLDLDINSLLI